MNNKLLYIPARMGATVNHWRKDTKYECEIMNNKLSYVPAGPNYASQKNWEKDFHYKEFDLKWFTDDSFFKYPYMLDNAYYSIKLGNIREYYRYPEDYILYGDSGGFQLLTAELKGKKLDLDPVDILRWLELNCNIGMNLDHPPSTNFNLSLARSVANFKIFEENRLNYKMKLYNVLHGRTLGEIGTWYDEVKNFNFDGWAIGVRPHKNSFIKLIAFLYLINNNAANLINNIHFFGISDIKNVLLLTILSDYFNTDISYDSSSWTLGSKFRKFYLPMNTRYSFDLSSKDNKKLDAVPCYCPVCSNFDVDLFNAVDNSLSGQLLSLHNMYQFIAVNDFLNIIIKDRELFDIYAASISERGYINIIYDIIKDYECHSLKFVIDKYKNSPVFRSYKIPHGSATQKDFNYFLCEEVE